MTAHRIEPGTSPGQWLVDGIPAEIITHTDLVQILVDVAGAAGGPPSDPAPDMDGVRSDADRIAGVRAVMDRWTGVSGEYTHIKISVALSDLQTAIE